MSAFSTQSAKLPRPEPQMTATFGRYFVLTSSHSAAVFTDCSRFSILKTRQNCVSIITGFKRKKLCGNMIQCDMQEIIILSKLANGDQLLSKNP